MFKRYAPALAAAALAALACGCSSLLTYYLVSEYLSDSAPKRTWTGTVSNGAGDPVEGLQVQVRATASGDDNVMIFSDGTDTEGFYSIAFRWNENITYALRVLEGENIVAEKYVGKIPLADQTTNLVAQASINSNISGLVRDAAGAPIEGALLIAGTYGAAGSDPVLFIDAEGATAYDLSGESGIYEIGGPLSGKAVVCAFHPDHGFAYATGEDTDEDGELALDITMGNTGQYTVNVQVLNGIGQPIEDTVLAGEQQFRLRLSTPFNLGSEVDQVAADNDLFGAFTGEPSDLHPSATTLLVQSTGPNGIADNSVEIAGGAYSLTLLEVDSADPPAALVLSQNPLALGADAQVVVRVN